MLNERRVQMRPVVQADRRGQSSPDGHNCRFVYNYLELSTRPHDFRSLLCAARVRAIREETRFDRSGCCSRVGSFWGQFSQSAFLLVLDLLHALCQYALRFRKPAYWHIRDSPLCTYVTTVSQNTNMLCVFPPAPSLIQFNILPPSGVSQRVVSASIVALAHIRSIQYL